jgi:bifunctional DNase/RNase
MVQIVALCPFTSVRNKQEQLWGQWKIKSPPRPLTHDLIVNMLETWNMTLDKVIIHTLQKDTFYAALILQQGDVKKEIDVRPSDAIAIALRTNTPIWVMEEVVANASIPVDRDADEAEQEAFREFISNLRPEDLIKRFGNGD